VLQIFRSVVMTPYLAALDRRRHHRHRPGPARPGEADVSSDRLSSIVGPEPESANNNPLL
jgi:hypothetical protein